MGIGRPIIEFLMAPLRNLALQPAFMHDGAFVRLEDAVRYHLDALGSAAGYGTAALPPAVPNGGAWHDEQGWFASVRPVKKSVWPAAGLPGFGLPGTFVI